MDLFGQNLEPQFLNAFWLASLLLCTIFKGKYHIVMQVLSGSNLVQATFVSHAMPPKFNIAQGCLSFFLSFHYQLFKYIYPVYRVSQ